MKKYNGLLTLSLSVLLLSACGGSGGDDAIVVDGGSKGDIEESDEYVAQAESILDIEAAEPIVDAELEQCVVDTLAAGIKAGTMTNLASLNQLTCNGLSITDLSGISSLTGLSELRLDDNMITTANLSGNDNLYLVTMHNNLLTDITFPEVDPKITFLGLANNELTTLDVSKLCALHGLYAQNNKLQDLKIAGLYKLKAIDISDNYDAETNPNGIQYITGATEVFDACY